MVWKKRKSILWMGGTLVLTLLYSIFLYNYDSLIPGFSESLFYFSIYFLVPMEIFSLGILSLGRKHELNLQDKRENEEK